MHTVELRDVDEINEVHALSAGRKNVMELLLDGKENPGTKGDIVHLSFPDAASYAAVKEALAKSIKKARAYSVDEFKDTLMNAKRGLARTIVQGAGMGFGWAFGGKFANGIMNLF